MKDIKKPQGPAEAPAKESAFVFLQKTYDETFSLLNIVSEYFQVNARKDRFNLSQDDRIKYTVAMSSITVQLTSVMSWLMAWKAVETKEITPKEALSDKYSLQIFTGFTNYDQSQLADLSQPLPEFLMRSASLYKRVQRLERSMKERYGS